jgi:FkbM family methyltransferase
MLCWREVKRVSGQFGEVTAIIPIFRGITNGFYVDIGAHDGVTDSNTLEFDKVGWNGICVEPHRAYYQRLIKNRPRAKNFGVAIWKEDNPEMPFFATNPGGFSRLVEELPHPDHRAVTSYNVQAITMKRLLEENNVPKPFDLLSIDVEEHETEVLSTFDICEYCPRVVIIEDMRFKGFDDFFEGYTGFKSWQRGIGGSNIIYIRDAADANKVRGQWKGQWGELKI